MSDAREEFVVARGQGRNRDLPYGTANAPFVGAYHRESWTMRADGRIVPDLLIVPMEPGLYGVGEKRRHDLGAMYEKVTLEVKGRGMTVIAPEREPGLGAPVVAYDVRDRASGAVAKRYAFRWEMAHPLTDRVTFDHHLHDRFLAAWRERYGIPEKPPEDVINSRVVHLEITLARRESKSAAPDRDPRVRALRRELDAWRALLEEPVVAAPTTERGAPVVEPSKPEPSKSEQPNQEQPKAEPAKAEPAKTGKPATDKAAKAAKAEQPKDELVVQGGPAADDPSFGFVPK